MVYEAAERLIAGNFKTSGANAPAEVFDSEDFALKHSETKSNSKSQLQSRELKKMSQKGKGDQIRFATQKKVASSFI